MAEAPGHRLGQIIGESLERALEPVLQEIADLHGLYLDRKGPRSARSGQKVTWTDSLGNAHDLDYVLERGGTDAEVGLPVAFIETAWRRYTKHSRNKAQEIQGAALPLLTTHSESKPFAGAVLGGVFTSGSLDQLRSNGFEILYIPYKEIISAFAKFGIDVAYDETTRDAYLAEQIEQYETLAQNELEALAEALRDTAPDEFHTFDDALERTLSRRIEAVTVLPLHGSAVECMNVQQAIEVVRTRARRGLVEGVELPFVRLEVIVRYSNKDRITATFADADDAERFLRTFE